MPANPARILSVNPHTQTAGGGGGGTCSKHYNKKATRRVWKQASWKLKSQYFIVIKTTMKNPFFLSGYLQPPVNDQGWNMGSTAQTQKSTQNKCSVKVINPLHTKLGNHPLQWVQSKLDTQHQQRYKHTLEEKMALHKRRPRRAHLSSFENF